MNKASLRFLLPGIGLVLMVICGYWLLFTQFMVYDDEGYVLWSLHNYFSYGGLYTKVYSQYGPFLYTFYHALHAWFGLTFDNETGRLLTLFYWIGAATLSGIFAWRQTRSSITTLVASALTFGGLLIMTSEPVHPGGLLAFLAALGTVLGAQAMEKNRPVRFAGLCGVIGAAMVLTKINVGAFFLIASVSWMAINLPHPKLVRGSLWLAALGSLLLPLWLMQRLWPAPWVATFCLTFSCAALALLILAARVHRSQFNFRAWAWFTGLAIAVAGLIGTSVWSRGTSLAMLWQGVVAAPLRQPLVYAYPVHWPMIVPWLAIGLGLLAVLAAWCRSTWILTLIATLRLLAGCWLLVQSLQASDSAVTFFSFRFSLPLAWLMTYPLRSQTSETLIRSRIWLAWVFVWQTLQAYPVAGSQMGWGAFLWIPLAIVGCHEAVCFWAERASRWTRWIKGTAAMAGLASITVLLGGLGIVGYQRYFIGSPLGLHGATNLRLSDDITSIYRILDKNVRLHGDVLFTYPGMFSFNLWTESPSPTTANVTHWFSLLNDEQQQAIVDQIKQDTRPVLVVQSYLIAYLINHGYAPRGILRDYLMESFAPAFRIDTYEFWVKKGRSIAPVSTAQLLSPSEGGTARLELVTNTCGIATALEIRGLFHPYNEILRLSADADSPWQITPLHPDNSTAGPTSTSAAPITLSGPTRITIPLPANEVLPRLDLLEVFLIDESGNRLDALHFRH